MGYDMHQVIEHPEYAAEKAKRKAQIDEIDARIKALKEAGADGSWLSEFEEAALTEEEKKALVHERSREHVQTYRKGLKDGADFNYDEERRAMLLGQTRPATEEYVTALEERDKAIQKVAPHDEYFRLNGFGMGRYADMMHKLGMLKDTRPDREDWPRSPEDLDDEVEEVLNEALWASSRSSRPNVRLAIKEGVEDEWWQKYYGPESENPKTWTPEQLDAYVAYREQVNEHLRRHDATVPGVEAIKYSTNDGWWVTKEECASVVAIWEAHPQQVRDAVVQELGDYWLAWMDYHRDGAAGDGYTVH